MREMASMALADVGSLRTISRRRAPVSAARLDEVKGPAICPVAHKRVDMDGIPYVCIPDISFCGGGSENENGIGSHPRTLNKAKKTDAEMVPGNSCSARMVRIACASLAVIFAKDFLSK